MGERDLILGIDPGGSGGMAIVDAAGGIVGAWPQPDTERDIYELLAEFAPRISRCYLEAVHSFPGKGEPCPTCHRRGGQGIVSAFTFGQNYGFLRGTLIASQIPFQEVRPQKWTKGLGLVGGK